MLNNPFCYTPSASIVEAARALSARIDADPALHALFAEGKMLGVLEVEPAMEEEEPRSKFFLYAFSGLAGGSAFVEGFVPPIFAWSPEDIRSSSPEESRRLQDWLFDQYVVVNGLGERRSIRHIFADRGLVPPGGTGDCAAPKLLQYALLHGLKPLAIGEFWYGASPAREVRRNGAFYPACTGKCGPLLAFMLQGVEVEANPLESDAHWNLEEPVVRYEDRSLIIVEKPAGMLAVPGRPVEGIAPRLSLQEWLTRYCNSNGGAAVCRPAGGQAAETTVLACHRLDMDTSGLMIFAKTPAAQAALQQQFEKREVSKAYLAWVMAPDAKREAPGNAFAGPAPVPAPVVLRQGDRGKITLPLAPDWYDRPRQVVDPEGGKPAVTEYEVLRTAPSGEAFLSLIPYTGRTHQLRVHCAHAAGLGCPIIGDRLYGGTQAHRLMLHAAYLSFRHPDNGRRLSFDSRFSPILT